MVISRVSAALWFALLLGPLLWPSARDYWLFYAGSAFGILGVPVSIYLEATMMRRRWAWAYGALTFLLSFGIYSASTSSEERQLYRALSVLQAALYDFDKDSETAYENAPTAEERARIILRVVAESMLVASDGAVIEFDRNLDIWNNPAQEASVTGCALAARGGRSIGEKGRETERRARAQSLALLFERARAGGVADPRGIDQKRANTILRSVLRAADCEDLASDPRKLVLVPDSQACDVYLKIKGAIYSLPSPDAALVIRFIWILRASERARWLTDPDEGTTPLAREPA